MNYEDLIELREIFRKEMEEHDFCIGGEQVERVFRELLGEPEPIYEHHLTGNEPIGKITSAEVAEVMKNVITKKVIEDIFNRDDAFYRNIKK